MYMPHFLHLFVRRWTLRLLLCLGFVDDAAVNMGVQIPL